MYFSNPISEPIFPSFIYHAIINSWHCVFAQVYIDDLVLRGDTVDEDGQNTPPGVHIIGGDTLGVQDIEKKATEVLWQSNITVMNYSAWQ